MTLTVLFLVSTCVGLLVLSVAALWAWFDATHRAHGRSVEVRRLRGQLRRVDREREALWLTLQRERVSRWRQDMQLAQAAAPTIVLPHVVDRVDAG